MRIRNVGFAFALIASVALLTSACHSDAPSSKTNVQSQLPEAINPGYPDVGFAWLKSALLEEVSPESTFIRAATESLVLLSKTQDPSVIYPGTREAFASLGSEQNSRAERLLRREGGNGVRIRGTFRPYILDLERISANEVAAYICVRHGDMGVAEHPGDKVYRSSIPSTSKYFIRFEKSGVAPRSTRRGGKIRPSHSEFGAWKILEWDAIPPTARGYKAMVACNSDSYEGIVSPGVTLEGSRIPVETSPGWD